MTSSGTTMLTAFRIRSSAAAASTASRHGMIRSGALRVPSVVWRSTSTEKGLHASRATLFCYRREAARTPSSCAMIRHSSSSSSSSSGQTDESRLTPMCATHTVDAPLLNKGDTTIWRERSLRPSHYAVAATTAASFSTATNYVREQEKQERRAQARSKLAAKNESPALALESSSGNDNDERNTSQRGSNRRRYARRHRVAIEKKNVYIEKKKLAAKNEPPALALESSFGNDNDEGKPQGGGNKATIKKRAQRKRQQARDRLVDVLFSNDNNEGETQLGNKDIELETDVDTNRYDVATPTAFNQVMDDLETDVDNNNCVLEVATPIAFKQVMDDLKQARQEYYLALDIPEALDMPEDFQDLFEPSSVLSAEMFSTIRTTREAQLKGLNKASFKQLEETEPTYRNLCHFYRHAVVESFRYASLIPNLQLKIREAYRALLFLSEYEHLRAQREIMVHQVQQEMEEMEANRIQEEANEREEGTLGKVKSLFKAAFETQIEVDPETKDDKPIIVDNILTAHRDPDFTPNQNLYEFLIKEDLTTSADKVHVSSSKFYYQVMLLMKDSFRSGNPHVRPKDHMYSLFFSRLVMTGTLADAIVAEHFIKEVHRDRYREENNVTQLDASEAEIAYMHGFKTFLPVFRLYREAAKGKHPDESDRKDAAYGAERLLLQLMQGLYHNGPKDGSHREMTTSPGQYTDWQTKCNAHRLVLSTMLNADPINFLYVLNRTNGIMESFMGKDNWKRLHYFDAAEKIDAECLTNEWINRGLNSTYGSSLL
eukprot:scaffold653047_cov59-Attheya_sp.AAC.3